MYELNEIDMMVESICIVLDEHGIKCADGHWMTAEEVVSLPEVEIINLFNQIYGRDRGVHGKDCILLGMAAAA